MLCHRIFKHSISIFLIYLFVLLFADPVSSRRVAKKLIVVSVATDITDGFLRFNRSLSIYGLQLEILGLHTPWNGGDVARHAGGGQKILLFQHYLESVRNEEELLILFTDSYDVIFTDGAQEIIRRFEKFNANVIFSSEKSCWPDHSLASKYPKEDNNRYLNSGGIIGFAPELYALTNLAKIKDNDDDQLFFTKIYLDQRHREKMKMKLDRNNFIFQSLYGEVGDIEIRFTEAPLIDKTNADSHAFNKATQTRPIVVHGNGLSKPAINSLGNYLAKSWHPAVGCMACEENRINLETLKHEDYPHVLIAINIFQPTPFFPEFLEYITSLDYYKDKITLFIQSKTDYHSNQITELLENFKSFYRNTKYIEDQEQEEWQIRNAYVDECTRVKCDYLFVVDSEARITNPRTLRNLIEANRSIIAPMLVRPKEYWSNFWGAITEDGFYSRSFDYVAIIKNERRGIWNVPYISTAYLIKSRPLFNKEYSLSTQKYLPFSYRFNNSLNDEDPDDNSLKTLDPDMYMCAILRSGGVFMFVDNLEDHGHLAQMDTMNIKLKHPEFYEIYSNEIDWRKRYIHENYTNNLLESTIIEQPCPDVYWFPVVTPTFCRHLIEIMENFGEWSAGKNQDPRLSGGYENVPTRDIHMNQVGLEQHWLYFLREYIRPVQEKIFIGYYHDPPKALMNFVVRYHPQEQAFLRPHHDASTYTINIALNRPKIDYEGGGCRFLRYNCSLLDLRLGWSLIHPGRLTHYHEGLTVTKGVRYIMVSFVDP